MIITAELVESIVRRKMRVMKEAVVMMNRWGGRSWEEEVVAIGRYHSPYTLRGTTNIPRTSLIIMENCGKSSGVAIAQLI
jgi:hypothetical protein